MEPDQPEKQTPLCQTSLAGSPSVGSSLSSHQRTETVSVLARIPPEIVTAIAGLFCEHCHDPTGGHETDMPHDIRENFATLSALSKTCTWMKFLVQPILHHKFALISSPIAAAQIYWFIRTITERHDLANAVHMLDFDQRRWFDGYPHDQPGSPGTRLLVQLTEVERLQETVSLFGLRFAILPLDDLDDFDEHQLNEVCNPEDRDRAIGYITLGSEEYRILARLAIPLTPRAKVVNFGQCTEYHTPGLTLTRSLQATNQNKRRIFTICPGRILAGLEHVETVRIRGECYPALFEDLGKGFDMRNLKNLAVSMPRLRKLQLLFGRFHDDDVWDDDTDSSDNALTQHRKGSTFGAVKCCDNLVEFTYIAMNHDLSGREISGYPVSGEASIQASELTTMLQEDFPTLHKTLRRLTIEHLSQLSDTYTSHYTSIDRFTALQRLYIGANGLFGALEDEDASKAIIKILPQGVRYLHIFEARDWYEEVHWALREILAKFKEKKFQNLREIRVSFRPLWPWMTYWSEEGRCSEGGHEWYKPSYSSEVLFQSMLNDAEAIRLKLSDEVGWEVPPGVQELSYWWLDSPLPRSIPWEDDDEDDYSEHDHDEDDEE